MEQLELTQRSLRAAIEEEISDAGGWYAVAEALYPAKYQNSPEAAERHLRNSVDPEHSQKLCVYQHQVIKGMAKKRRGRVASIIYDCREHVYTTPEPITPEQKMASLQRKYIEAVDLIAGIAQDIKAASKTQL